MEMIPMENQPIEGTSGAQHRNRQIQKQLPDHDQQPELCQQLNTEEAEKMADFVKDYKEKAVGIGQVSSQLSTGFGLGLGSKFGGQICCVLKRFAEHYLSFQILWSKLQIKSGLVMNVFL